jgi:hypothetical protein
MRYYSVLKLEIAFKFEIDKCQREIGRIITALRRSAKTGMHTKRMIAFAIVTTEASVDLLNRLRPILSEIDAIDNFWCSTAPRDLVGMNGAFDPMSSRINEAWHEARYRNYPQYVEKPESLQLRI